jgi:succinate-semialdehyde dehydrogenase/glutarate-semialdehyde dehydrogenase
MCTKKGLDTTKRHAADALEKGARLVSGGFTPEIAGFPHGYWYAPTILADASRDMLVMREETFGPAVGVAAFDDIDDAITLANDTDYGLAAIVYSSNIHTIKRCALEIDAGNVAVNNVDAGVLNAPYGGWKSSGFGREHGPEGLFEYLQAKHIRVKA